MARNEATKRPGVCEEAPHKRRKVVGGCHVTVLTPRAEQLNTDLLTPAGPHPEQDLSRKRPAEASPNQPKRLKKASEQRGQGEKRRASPSPDSRCLKKAKIGSEEKNANVKLASRKRQAPERPQLKGRSTAEERARHYLAHLGVRLLKEKTIRKMVSCGGQSLGEGTYGSCCRGVDPHAGKELVIKTFVDNDLRSFVTETKCLHRLQGHGMQRLVGVCVETRQLVTRFAGQTAADYFHSGARFSHALSVILQMARVLRNVHGAGYTHNDIKSNNVCVKQCTNGPKATVIDLGMAERVGTRGFYKTDKDLGQHMRKYPWIGPELLRDSHPCSAASDVYSVAWFILCVPGWRKRPVVSPTMRLFKEWVKKARRPHPEQRPSLDDLIRVIKQLQAEMASSTRLKK